MDRDASFLRAWAETAAGSPGPIAQAPVDVDGAGDGLRFRSCWISNVRLGTPGCRAHASLELLTQTECETLYRVGDMVDGWELRRSWFSNVANGTANKGGRLDLSDAMMASVAAFASNGDPNNATLGVVWAPWPQKLIFDASLTAKTISVQ